MEPSSHSSTRDGLSVIVPAFNEEESIADAVAAMLEDVSRLGVPFEIVIVNDGSRDRTGAIGDELAARDSRVRIVHHPVNRRSGAALRTGGEAAAYDRAVVMPVDNPIPIDELRRLLEASEHAAIAVGYRADRPGYATWMKVASRIYRNTLNTMFGMSLRDLNWCCVYRTEVLRSAGARYDGILGFPEVLIRAHRQGHRLVEVPLSMRPRVTGRPTVSRMRTLALTSIDVLGLFWELRVKNGRSERPSRAAAAVESRG